MNMLTLAASLLLSGAGMAACSDSEQAAVAGTPPAAASEEVTAFFKAHLPESSTNHSEVEFNFSELDFNETECILINSAEEFAAVAPPTAELPAIDFEKYTLVIGQHQMGCPAYRLEEQAVDAESGPDKMTLNLVYSQGNGPIAAVVTTFYVWGLYDKLPSKPIGTAVTIR